MDPSSSSTPPPNYNYNSNSILHQFTNLSLGSSAGPSSSSSSSSVSTADGASRLPPPYVNNYSPLFHNTTNSNAWIEMPLAADLGFIQRELRPEEVPAPYYSPLELHRLRIDSAAAGSSSGSYSGSFGLVPTRMNCVESYDYPDLMMMRRSMLANGDGFYAGNNILNNFNLTGVFERNRIRNSNRNNRQRNNPSHYHHRHRNHNGHCNVNIDDELMMNLLAIMNMKLPTWADVRGRVADLAMDQTGCTLLKYMLKKGEHHLCGLEIPVHEVKLHIAEIITNEFGAEFFKEFLIHCNHHHVSEFFTALVVNNHFFEICIHPRGTYAVQELLNKMNNRDPNLRAIVASAMVPITLKLSKDNNGGYVMNACLKSFAGFNDVIEPILEEIGNNCLDIAKNKSGCCVLQHCLAQPGCGRGRGRLLHVIINHAYQLANNEYGNYVIQFVISMRSDAINTKVMKKLEGSFATLAESKYGSHVVERCLKDFRDDMVKLIIEELCDAPNFFDILDHQMGNYVAQTALHRSKAMLGCSYTKSPHQMLVSRINTYYAFLKGREYGKRVLNHVKCKCKLEEFGFNVDYFY